VTHLINHNLSPCCNAPRIFLKEQQDLDGSCSNVKYKCTGCGREYWAWYEDPALSRVDLGSGLTELEKAILRIPVIRYLYLIPLFLYNHGLGILEEAKYRVR
jgi:hypothetical protein